MNKHLHFFHCKRNTSLWEKKITKQIVSFIITAIPAQLKQILFWRNKSNTNIAHSTEEQLQSCYLIYQIVS